MSGDEEKQDLSSQTMTLPEAAKLAGIRYRTMHHYAAVGKLKGQEGYNGRVLATIRDIEALLDVLERDGRNVSANRALLREKMAEKVNKGGDSDGTSVP